MKRTLQWTGERYLPWAEDPATSYEHWHRYAFASRFTPGKRVLDLASGEGYGAALLSQTARLTVGVDTDRDAVRHARERYGGGNLNFMVGSAASIPIRDNSFDVITCFELIEHIQEQDELLREAKRLLAPEGLLLISTPNKPEYTQAEISNPFHTKELEFNEFQDLVSRYFKEIRLLGQRVYSCSSLWPAQAGGSDRISEFFLAREADEFVLSNSRLRIPLYFVAIASNADSLPPSDESVLVDTSNFLSKQAGRIQKELETTLQSREEALAWREEQIKQLQLAISSQQGQIDQLQRTISSQNEGLSWMKGQVDQLHRTISSQEKALEWREAQVEERNQAIESISNDLQLQKKLAGQLQVIQASRSWRLIQKFLRIRDNALPVGTSRRSVYDRLLVRIGF